jgi:rubrerythrin
LRVSHRPRCLKIFEEPAENEKQHAKDHLQLLNGIGDTATNLKEAMGGEDYEVESMYPEFAKIAEEEGETAAAIAFNRLPKSYLKVKQC